MNIMEKFDNLIAEALALGAFKANVIAADKIECDRIFRDICASNGCGMYGKCYMCPPDIGPVEDLMDKVRGYDRALLYQTVAQLEDSFDFEGMTEVSNTHAALSQRIHCKLGGQAVIGGDTA